jgi:mono/diheme cytochrome c family protein
LIPKRSIFVFLSLMLSGGAFWAAAQERSTAPHPASIKAADSASSAAANAVSNHNEAAERLEGEKQFKANCVRCHAAPSKFPARMMATIVRHMRVRSTITDEDARLILHYMTQ